MRRFPGPRRSAEPVIRELADHLEAAGVPVLDARTCSEVGVLVTAEVIVWCYRRLLHWRCQEQDVTWPAADAYGAARRLVESVWGGKARM